MFLKKRIVIISEVGWQGARELSLEISESLLDVALIIKGRPQRAERDMITKYRRIRNIFIFRKLFTVMLFIYILYYVVLSKSLFIFTTKEKIERRLLRLRKIFKNIHLAKLREIKGHFAVFDLGMNRIDYRTFLEIL